MPPLWQTNLAIILAAIFWYATNMLIPNGMEDWARLAVHITLALYTCHKIAAAIGWILDQIDP
jgi:hypothetical protein